MYVRVVDFDGQENPADDGCSASYSIVHTETYPGTSGHLDYFQLRAEEAEGWSFREFRWTLRTETHQSDRSTEQQSYSEESPSPGVWLFPASGDYYSQLREGRVDYPDGRYYAYYVLDCEAVFTRVRSQVTVYAKPVYAGAGGALVFGGGTVDPRIARKEDIAGKTSTFTFTAAPDDGFEFVKWTSEDGLTELGTDEVLEFSVVHGNSDKEVSIRAWFKRKPTGKILRNSSGTILRGSGGDVLRDA